MTQKQSSMIPMHTRGARGTVGVCPAPRDAVYIHPSIRYSVDEIGKFAKIPDVFIAQLPKDARICVFFDGRCEHMRPVAYQCGGKLCLAQMPHRKSDIDNFINRFFPNSWDVAKFNMALICALVFGGQKPGLNPTENLYKFIKMQGNVITYDGAIRGNKDVPEIQLVSRDNRSRYNFCAFYTLGTAGNFVYKPSGMYFVTAWDIGFDDDCDDLSMTSRFSNGRETFDVRDKTHILSEYVDGTVVWLFFYGVGNNPIAYFHNNRLKLSALPYRNVDVKNFIYRFFPNSVDYDKFNWALSLDLKAKGQKVSTSINRNFIRYLKTIHSEKHK